jgi:hypothetical protein
MACRVTAHSCWNRVTSAWQCSSRSRHSSGLLVTYSKGASLVIASSRSLLSRRNILPQHLRHSSWGTARVILSQNYTSIVRLYISLSRRPGSPFSSNAFFGDYFPLGDYYLLRTYFSFLIFYYFSLYSYFFLFFNISFYLVSLFSSSILSFYFLFYYYMQSVDYFLETKLLFLILIG